MSSVFLNVNGGFQLASEPLILADNRAFRYGEGLFETMRLQHGKIALWDAHYSRLENSMSRIGLKPPVHLTKDQLYHQIQKLAEKNKHSFTRVRLTVYRGEGGIWETPSVPFNYLIQTWSLPDSLNRLNENGIDLGVFMEGRKSCDAFASLKSNNYLLYLLAANFAKTQKWNECLVLNQYERIADATIANLFFIREGNIFTPAISEGGVEGVMRNYLITQFRASGFKVEEGAYTIKDLEQADEVFLTNAIHGIKWVKSFGNSNYSCLKTALLFEQHIKPLFG
jgi:branched-chain amino acid aminotransferase